MLEAKRKNLSLI